MKNLKRATFWLSFFIVLLCLQGCKREDGVEDFTCTAEQLDLVKKEFEICRESSYLTSYCFLQAKKTQCDLITKEA
jgi:hypothetical protein